MPSRPPRKCEPRGSWAAAAASGQGPNRLHVVHAGAPVFRRHRGRAEPEGGVGRFGLTGAGKQLLASEGEDIGAVLKLYNMIRENVGETLMVAQLDATKIKLESDVAPADQHFPKTLVSYFLKFTTISIRFYRILTGSIRL